MIVDTMSMEEVGKAVIKAAIASRMKIFGLVKRKENKYRKVILKGGEKYYDFKPIPMVTDGITFYVCPHTKGKRDYKKYGILYAVFAHFFYKGTNWYALLLQNYERVAIYQHHFFERYIERHLMNNSEVTLETVMQYFKETDYHSQSKPLENSLHNNCIYGATNIGVCCGYHCGISILIWLTYIDKETLTKGAKKEHFDKYKDDEPIGFDASGNRIYKSDLLNLYVRFHNNINYYG